MAVPTAIRRVGLEKVDVQAAAVNAADLGGDAESAAWAQPDPPERAMGRRWLACRRRRRRWDTMMRTAGNVMGKESGDESIVSDGSSQAGWLWRPYPRP